MKKLLLAIVLIATTTLTHAQSNTPGKIQLGLGWSVLLGGATLESKFAGVTTSEKAIGARANTGLRAQYGLTEKFSAGIYLRSEHAAYVTTTTDFGTSSDFTTTNSGIGFGLEGKFYPVNKDKFALYVGPTIGFGSTKDKFTGGGTNGKSSGLEYGVNVGFNWWWAQFIGMSLDLGYQGVGLKGSVSESGDKVDYKIKGGGVLFGLGLVTKFGGE